MTMHGQIVSVLEAASVAPGGVYPEFLPEQSMAEEYVIVRRAAFEPVDTLVEYIDFGKSTFVLERWAGNKARALEIADSVRTAMAADDTIKSKVLEPVAGEDYAQEVMATMEPVQYGIWH